MNKRAHCGGLLGLLSEGEVSFDEDDDDDVPLALGVRWRDVLVLVTAETISNGSNSTLMLSGMYWSVRQMRGAGPIQCSSAI
jgi:hypothetical protein